MTPNDDDPNPWIFGNDMTINGCQGLRASAPASSASGTTGNTGKPPASDRQPPAEDPNAKTQRKHSNSSSSSDSDQTSSEDNQDIIKNLRNDVLKPGRYSFGNAGPYQWPSALSREYQMGSSPSQTIPGLNVPRSMCPELDDSLRAEYRASVADDSPKLRGQGQKSTAKMKPESSKCKGPSDPPGPTDQRGPIVEDEIIQQYPRGTQSAAQRYRQNDTDDEPEEDAETDEEPF
jgi:hypothetical protein